MTYPLSSLFKRNKAKHFGGSVYQYSHHCRTDQCIFRIVENSTVKNITLSFLNSIATFGNDIFSNNLDECRAVINNQSSISGYEYLLNKNEFFSYASFPRQLCLLKNGLCNCSVSLKYFLVHQEKHSIFKLLVGAPQI